MVEENFVISIIALPGDVASTDTGLNVAGGVIGDLGGDLSVEIIIVNFSGAGGSGGVPSDVVAVGFGVSSVGAVGDLGGDAGVDLIVHDVGLFGTVGGAIPDDVVAVDGGVGICLAEVGDAGGGGGADLIEHDF